MLREEDIILPKNVTLEIIKGADAGKTIAVNSKTITIGRGEGCDVKLADAYVSAKHCQIVFRYRTGHFTVIDLGSLNKVKVNGNMYVQRNLRNNDVIQLGQTEMMFHWGKADYEEYLAGVPEDFKKILQNAQEEDIPLPASDDAVRSNE
ncbi:MAG: FHA domain-containing protein [Spirochaetales bacterium]|nr:FHA domain-containing protein [Spirochaetales bacterium]